MPEGRVVAFDESRGLGEIEAGDRRYPFHCTEIADGSRTIAVEVKVTFEINPGTLGRWEATNIRST